MNHALQGYQSARVSTVSPRGAERLVLRKLAAEMESAGDDYAKLSVAIQRNTELWTTLAVDLAGAGNALPEALRAALLSLANFAVRHAGAVLMGDAKPDALIEINRNVAAGLDQAQIAEAA